MKRFIGFVISLALITVLAACGNGGESARPVEQPAGVNDVLEAGMAEAEGRQSGVNEDAPLPVTQPDPAAAGSSDGIDVDLTALSSTMVYSEVYNMMVAPADYLGKTVKMSGAFNYYHDEAADNYYFACIIKDATACCAQGIEFELAGDHRFPEDYPEVDAVITVIGVFDTYQEGEYTYCTLRNAQLL